MRLDSPAIGKAAHLFTTLQLASGIYLAGAAVSAGEATEQPRELVDRGPSHVEMIHATPKVPGAEIEISNPRGTCAGTLYVVVKSPWIRRRL